MAKKDDQAPKAPGYREREMLKPVKHDEADKQDEQEQPKRSKDEKAPTYVYEERSMAQPVKEKKLSKRQRQRQEEAKAKQAENAFKNVIPAERVPAHHGPTSSELAMLLGKPKVVVDHWIRTGLLTRSRDEHGSFRLSLSEVDSLLSNSALNTTVGDLLKRHAPSTQIAQSIRKLLEAQGTTANGKAQTSTKE